MTESAGPVQSTQFSLFMIPLIVEFYCEFRSKHGLCVSEEDGESKVLLPFLLRAFVLILLRSFLIKPPTIAVMQPGTITYMYN